MIALRPTFKKEAALFTQGFSFVAGIDEAGRGAWAGPVVAAAVIFPPGKPDLLTALAPIRDSKLLTARQRENLLPVIKAYALAVGVGVASPSLIDRTNIIAATRFAMRRAVEKLSPRPQFLLIDALRLPQVSIPQDVFFKAESISLSVAAASIVAKVTRDRLMIFLAEKYPQYGFERHKGYGTKLHQENLARFGACRIHRFSFSPIKTLSPNKIKSV